MHSVQRKKNIALFNIQFEKIRNNFCKKGHKKITRQKYLKKSQNGAVFFKESALGRFFHRVAKSVCLCV